MRIRASDIVGARVVEVYTKCETSDGLSICESFFTVDRGFSFAIPYRGEVWSTTEIPREAVREEEVVFTPVQIFVKKWFGNDSFLPRLSRRNEWLTRLKRAQIVGAFVHRPQEDDWEPSEAILAFDDGSQLWNYTCVPEGIPFGLVYVERGSEGCIPMGELMDYFSFPVADREK